MKKANYDGLPKDVIINIAFDVCRELNLEDVPADDVQTYAHSLANEWRKDNGKPELPIKIK